MLYAMQVGVEVFVYACVLYYYFTCTTVDVSGRCWMYLEGMDVFGVRMFVGSSADRANVMRCLSVAKGGLLTCMPY